MYNPRNSKNKPVIDTKRYSGLRLLQEPDKKVVDYQWQQLVAKLKGYLPIVEELRKEQFYLDDSFRVLPDPMAAIIGNLGSSEIFFSFHDKVLVALVTLTDILVDRRANFEAWVNPLFRQDFQGRRLSSTVAHEIIDYAFAPWPNGLGLVKLKSSIGAPNRASFRAARSLGFEPIGYSKLDALYHGVPTDTVLLELLNPRFFKPVVESMPNGQINTEHTDVHTDGGVHAPSELSISTSSSERGELQRSELRSATGPDDGGTSDL